MKALWVSFLAIRALQAGALKVAATHTSANGLTGAANAEPTETHYHYKKPAQEPKPWSAKPLQGTPLDFEERSEEAKRAGARVGKSVQPARVEKTVKDAAQPIHEYPSWRFSLLWIIVYAVFVLLFALLYDMYCLRAENFQYGRDPPLHSHSWLNCGFSHSCIDCGNLHKDWRICLCSLCCPIIQWSSTASKSSFMGAMSYWKAIALMLGLAVLSPFTYGFSDIVILFLLVTLRQHLHALYKHTQSGVLSWFQDCCFVFCCNPFLCCQLVQEAREVETDPIQYVKFADSDPETMYVVNA